MHNKNGRCSIIPTVACSVAALVAAGLISTAHAQTTSTTLKVGGYIKLDAMSSAYSDGDIPVGNFGRDFYVPSLLPVAAAGVEDESRDTDFHAKSSRINFQTTTDVEGEKLVSFIEIDFMAGPEGDERVSNSYQPRLRHAYFTYGKWLFGQTWSTFQNVAALPETLDFIGPVEGTVFVRQAQVRYTTGPWQFALENPETAVTRGDAGRTVTDDNVMPDLVARYGLKGDWGSFDVAGIARSLAYEDIATDIDDSTFGYGLSVSGVIKLGARDDIRAMVTHGSGLGRYVGLNIVNDAALDAGGDLELVDLTSAMISYRHFWTEQWRSSFSAGYFTADHDTALTSTAVTDQVTSMRINLLYSPAPKVTVGLELMGGKRELENGLSGTMNRLQFSGRYDF